MTINISKENLRPLQLRLDITCDKFGSNHK